MLKGNIKKDNKGYTVDLEWRGYGKLNLYDILKIEKLDKKIESMKDGEEININIT